MTYRLLTLALLGGALAAGSCLHGPAPHAAGSSPEPLAAHPRPALDSPAPAVAAASAPEAAAPTGEIASSAAPPRVDFTTQVQPLLAACRPCHFEGGKMYDRLPFDDPSTIRFLGERLFSRIQEDEAQVLIRAFLAQEGEPGPRGNLPLSSP